MARVDDPEVLARRLRPAVGGLVREVRRVDELSPRFAQVLGHLDRRGPLSPGELVELQGVRQQSMSATLTELAKLGYVKRDVDPADRRRARFAISAKGRRRLERERLRRADALAGAIASRLSRAERRDLAKALPLLERLAEPQTRQNPED